MPRCYDFIKSMTSHQHSHIAEPRFGAGEITEEQLGAEAEIYPPGFGRKHQFSAPWKNPIDQFQADMDGAFDWLCDNASGPWSWIEDWINHGHSLEVFLHIERLSDQALFQKTWGHAFQYREDRAADIEKLAVLKGVLPEDVSVAKWANRAGLRVEYNYYETTQSGEKERRLLIAALISAQADDFQKKWGNDYKETVGAALLSEGSSASTFLAASAPQTRFFVGPWPKPAAPRSIPQDFMDYYEGRCDFSAVQTIPVEKPSTSLQTLALGCK